MFSRVKMKNYKRKQSQQEHLDLLIKILQANAWRFLTSVTHFKEHAIEFNP